MRPRRCPYLCLLEVERKLWEEEKALGGLSGGDQPGLWLLDRAEAKKQAAASILETDDVYATVLSFWQTGVGGVEAV